MRAVVQDRYGPPSVLRLADVARPVPKSDEVLIKVHATTVSRTDSALRAGVPFVSRVIGGLRRPRRKILGSDLAGVVETVGRSVTEFKVGDHVFGINPWKFGAHAEFICMRAGGALAPMPAGMPFDEAAAVCDGAILALNAIRPARLRTGQRILSTERQDPSAPPPCSLPDHLVPTSLVCATPGTSSLCDHSEPTRSSTPRWKTSPRTAGHTTPSSTPSAISRSAAVAAHSKPGGVFLATDGMQNLVLTLWTARIGDKRVRFPIPPQFTKQDVVFLKQLIEAGKYRVVIDRRYPLEQVVEATRYVETKQKTGNVVLIVSRDAGT